MRQSSKIAQVYAEAYAGILEDNQGKESKDRALEEGERELRLLLEILTQDKMVWTFFSSPMTPWETKLGVLEKLQRKDWSESLFNFMRVLARRKRLNFLPSIVESYTEHADHRLNRRRVQVESARKISPERLAELTEALRIYLDATPVIETLEDPNLLGGIRIRSNDLLIDTSLRTALKNIGARLRERKIIGEGYYYEHKD